MGGGVFRLGEVVEIVDGCCGGGVGPVLTDGLIRGAPAAASTAVRLTRLVLGSAALRLKEKLI